MGVGVDETGWRLHQGKEVKRLRPGYWEDQ